MRGLHLVVRGLQAADRDELVQLQRVGQQQRLVRVARVQAHGPVCGGRLQALHLAPRLRIGALQHAQLGCRLSPVVRRMRRAHAVLLMRDHQARPPHRGLEQVQEGGPVLLQPLDQGRRLDICDMLCDVQHKVQQAARVFSHCSVHAGTWCAIR